MILQHFERGAKLNDSSNRYEHTCKGCGEKFPKGRIDSLTAHILKKCVAMRDQDRQKAAMEFNHMNEMSHRAHAHGDVAMRGRAVGLPLVNDNWSALETLAEVSRQIEMDEHNKHDGPPHDRAVGMGGSTELPRGDRLELQEQYTLDNPPVSYEQRVMRDRKCTSQLREPNYPSELTMNSYQSKI